MRFTCPYFKQYFLVITCHYMYYIILHVIYMDFTFNLFNMIHYNLDVITRDF
jgi:hypothetical protein